MSLYAGMTVNERLVISGQMAAPCLFTVSKNMDARDIWREDMLRAFAGHDETDLCDPHDFTRSAPARDPRSDLPCPRCRSTAARRRGPRPTSPWRRHRAGCGW